MCPPLAVATEKKKKIKNQNQINTIIIIQQKSNNISRTWGQEERGVVRGLAPLLWAWRGLDIEYIMEEFGVVED